ncbi:MAG: MOSC domain-containing protein [Campylobacterota bacterium]|nr:MOSC domain-containing protein [Campylobacterota bacterium]
MNTIILEDIQRVGDKFYGKNIDRSVLITSVDSYKIAKENGIDIAFGELGENILMDFSPYSLDVGTKIKIGDALLEISQECTLCKSFAGIHKDLPKILKNDRGIFAKVVNPAEIKLDSEVLF